MPIMEYTIQKALPPSDNGAVWPYPASTYRRKIKTISHYSVQFINLKIKLSHSLSTASLHFPNIRITSTSTMKGNSNYSDGSNKL